jgi:hypothetical protein
MMSIIERAEEAGITISQAGVLLGFQLDCLERTGGEGSFAPVDDDELLYEVATVFTRWCKASSYDSGTIVWEQFARWLELNDVPVTRPHSGDGLVRWGRAMILGWQVRDSWR